MKTLITLACCLFVWSQVAFGHAALVATSPAAGAVLGQAPQEITLRFDEPVRATTLRLFDPSGQ
ncbi:MAG TPA: copper resistance CopC family protein, partial [Castellaniella sp.]|nr:copper resistance CopC family protein [Castellaniella sp.]